MQEDIFVTRSTLPPFEEYVDAIRPIWESHWLTNMGPLHRQLEGELAAYLDAPFVTLFSNGHLALEMSLRAFGLSGEVITTPFTFVSTTHAIVRAGLEPVFADIDPATYTLDPACLEPLLTERTRAIVPVHVYGNLCDVAAIGAFAKKHGLAVIYDAAHAFGLRLDGVSAANFGDAAMYSFHATKVFHTIEGGAVAFRDEALQKKLNLEKNFGFAGEDNIEAVGGNAKLNEFSAAMGLCNLRHLNDDIAHRARVFARYGEHLAGTPGLRLPAVQPGVSPNYAYYPVAIDAAAFGASRDEAHAGLKRAGIFARRYFYPTTNSLTCYPKACDPAATPVALRASQQVLTLPMHSALTADEVDRVCRELLALRR